ncbi:5-(carboxyamino)imidazole ribonucleotide synthase [Nitrosomonas sp. PY1]|nr:5-(carboxyamino)imidazole ribonucleotide synthase [Nitrosomonas sp. PY1]
MLGVLGGGQLGSMFVTAAQKMGYFVTVLDPSPDSPAGRIADDFICANYTDQSALKKISNQCAAVTTEFENISADVLEALSAHCQVSPDAASVRTVQNRITEKQFLATNGFTIAPYCVIRHAEDLLTQGVDNYLPGILKVSQFGYDGKGQKRVENAADLKLAFEALNHSVCVLEKLIPLNLEVSVVVARSATGQIEIYPVSENQHVNGILDISIVPARITTSLANRAQMVACQIAEKLDYCGVLCVEFFVSATVNGELLVNEIAPRPHNSGHYSLDACITSQFEQQVRTLCRLSLGETTQHTPAIMVNMLGDLWHNGEPNWNHVLQHSSTKLHLYRKTEARPGRKMGHFITLNNSLETALQQAIAIKNSLNLN